MDDGYPSETTPPFGPSELDRQVAAIEHLANELFGVPEIRLVIAGVPSAGKTTLADLAEKLFPERPVRHTDDLIGRFGWSEGSAEAMKWFDEPGPWLVEGVAAVRALRKWLEHHPSGKPCDVVLWLDAPLVPISGRVEGLAKGCRTVWLGIQSGLRARGVSCRTSSP